MNQRVHLVTTFDPEYRWRLPKDCDQCGKPISKPPYMSRTSSGDSRHTKHFHAKCYPVDSRPRERER